MTQEKEPMLNVSVSGRNLEISDSLRDHVVHHLETVIEKYSQRPAQAKVTFRPEGEGFRCDCSLHLDSGPMLQSSGEAMDIHASLSSMFARIEKRLRRFSRRLKERHVENGETGLFAAEPIRADDDSVQDGYNDAGTDPAIIADSKGVIEELSVANAALKMEFSDKPVYLFRNSAHGGLDVVYQRPDGNIGWIDLNAYKEKSN